MTDNETIDRRDVRGYGEMNDDRSVNVLEHPLGDGFDLEEHYIHYEDTTYGERWRRRAGNKSKAARLLGMKTLSDS